MARSRWHREIADAKPLPEWAANGITCGGCHRPLRSGDLVVVIARGTVYWPSMIHAACV